MSDEKVQGLHHPATCSEVTRLLLIAFSYQFSVGLLRAPPGPLDVPGELGVIVKLWMAEWGNEAVQSKLPSSSLSGMLWEGLASLAPKQLIVA